MTQHSFDIGFIGLGAMGGAIARNLLDAGHRVTVWNRSPDKAAPLVEAGATHAATPREAARGDFVLTMLADDAALEAVVFGEQGILSSDGRPVHVSLSTVSPALAERLAAAHGEAGFGFVAAPVFGRPDVAASGQLNIVAAGDADVVARCQPVFDAIGQRVFAVGAEPAMANTVKICGNFMILAAVEAMAEASTLAEKRGVPRAAFLEVMTETLFGSRAYRVYGDIIANDRYRPAGFAAPLGLKDMNLVAATASAARVPMPLVGVVRDHLLSALAQEGEDLDWSGLALAVRRDAGL